MRKRTTAATTMMVAATAAAVAIADPGGARPTGTVEVSAQRAPAAPVRVREHDGVARIAVRHVPGGPERLAWTTRPASAAAGEDFEAASGIVQFRPGERVRTVTIRVRADGVAEGDERFTVDLDAFPGLPETRGGAVATVVIADR